jgi:hypothetical protein
MVRKRTRQVSEVIGNAEPLLLDELTPVSAVELKREIEVDGVLVEDADLSRCEKPIFTEPSSGPFDSRNAIFKRRTSAKRLSRW